MNTVTLVACVAGKLDHPAPARDLYVSDWFRKARAYAEASGRDWFILSARHGLVHPDQELAPYDDTLIGANASRRLAWSAMVARQLADQGYRPGFDRCELLAGRAYREPLAHVLPAFFADVLVPLASLGIGSQKARLIQLTRTLEAA